MKPIVIVSLLAAFLGAEQSAFASPRELRIDLAEGTGAARGVLEVGAGETVSLAADIWAAGSECHAVTGCPQHVTPGEILWSADDRPEATCDLYSASACSSESSFRVTPGGVQFQVPASFTAPITVIARLRGGDLMGTFSLVPRPPAPVVAAPAIAPQERIVVVQQPGQWVIVNGLSVWRHPILFRPHPHWHHTPPPASIFRPVPVFHHRPPHRWPHPGHPKR